MSNNVAIYADFENLHAAVYEQEHHGERYHRERWKPQPPVVDVDAIMEYAFGHGRVVINRAYGNWQFMHKYRDAMLNNNVDMIQLWPTAGSKNAADIRLSLDVQADLTLYPEITHVIILAGDSDFIPLAQRVRRMGRRVIGVAGEESASRFLVAACDEFRFYRSIIDGQLETATPEDLDAAREDAGDLLVRAVRRLERSSPESGWALKSAVRPMLVRLDPSFELQRAGYRDLDGLLADNQDRLETRSGEHDQLLRVAAGAGSGSRVPDAESAASATGDREAARYARLLKSMGVRLLSPGDLQSGFEAVCGLAGERMSKDEFVDRVAEVFGGGAQAATMARKVRETLWKVDAFDIHENGDIEVQFEDLDDLWAAVLDEMVCRLTSQIGHPDEEVVATLFFNGDPSEGQKEMVQTAIAEATTADLAA